MKAIRIDHFVTDPSHLRVTTIPTPPPSPHTLRVRTTHASITHVDLLYAQGLHQNNRRHAAPPLTLGTEFAGVVLAAPPRSAFAPGTRVFGFAAGCFAEELCVAEAQLRRVPDAWSNAEACAAGPGAAVACGALAGAGRLGAGETVVVLGASGGLGVCAVQVARALGAGRVVGVVGEEEGEKAEVVRGLGAEVVGWKTEGWEKRVVEIAGGEGVDVVFDSIGAVDGSLKCVKYGGRVVIVGFAARGGQMENVRMNKVLLKGASVIGYRFGEQSRRNPSETEAIWDAVMRMVLKRQLRPVVYREQYHGLEEVSRAMGDVKARAVWGRAVVSVTNEREWHRRLEQKL